MSSKNHSTKNAQGPTGPALSGYGLDPAIKAGMPGQANFIAVFSVETKTGTVTLDRRKEVLPWLAERD